MEQYIIMIVAGSLIMSGVIFGLILFNKLFANKYPAKWRYYIWLIVLLGLLIPFRPDISLPFEPVQIPVSLINVIAEQPTANSLSERDSAVNQNLLLSVKTSDADIFAETTPKTGALSMASIIFIVWIVGAVCTVVFRLWCHRKFTRIVGRWATDINDIKILSLLAQVRAELNITRKIRLRKCKLITSPLLTGFIKPVILLPDGAIHDDEMLLVLKHELIHYKRKDLWINLLVIAATVIHWFNPAVYIMAAAIRNDCETSCDEAVLGNTGLENRRIYGETIIGFIRTNKTVKTVLSTNFYGGKNTMKKRIISMMDTSKKNIGAAVLCGFLVLTSTLLSGSALAFETAESIQQSVVITAEQSAREIALKESGGGVVVEFGLDSLKHNGERIKVYEIKIINGNTVYDIEIGVEDSVIYKSKISTKKNVPVFPANLIVPEKAEKIALERVGGGIIDEWELEYKKGVWIYEVEVKYNRTEYEVYINAETGEIIKFKIDD